MRNALSYASTPFSSLASKPRKSTVSSGKSTQASTRGSKQVEIGRPMFYEERMEQQKQTTKSEKDKHDIYVIPSTAGNSQHTPSTYSASRDSEEIKSKRTSHFEPEVHDARYTSTAIVQRPPVSRNSGHTRSTYSASRYSEGSSSKETSHVEQEVQDERNTYTAIVQRPPLSRNISASTREVPVRLDLGDVAMERVDEERGVLQGREYAYLGVVIDGSTLR